MQPLRLLMIVLIAALIGAILFVTFLVIPLAILLVVYIGLVAADRLRHQRDADDEQGAA